MIILHAAMAGGRLLVWGETPPAGPGRAGKRRGREAKEVQPLPFAAGATELAAALHEAFPDMARRAGKPESAVAWLPAVKGQPIASSPLIAEPPEETAAVELTPWTVTVVPLGHEPAIDLLGACLDRETLAPGVVVGNSLAFWATALRFAGSLVARQQFLPDVEPAGTDWRACWKPALTGADGSHFNQLARAMPAACRALSAGAEAVPDRAAATVLAEFVGAMVDTLVRSSIPPPPAMVQVRRRAAKTPVFDSVHDQWLYALRSADGAMEGKEVAGLAEQVRAWQRPIAVLAGSPFRLCFRLEEPSAQGDDNGFVTEGTWTVRYLLQALHDPSLLIPAADAWAPKGRRAKVLQQNGFRPREYLLTALGQAAGICPQTETSLKEAEPAGFTTATAGAHRFLTETAWLLEQAGFGVLLPAWWTRKGTKQRLTVSAQVKSPSMAGGSGLSLDTIVQFDWQVALGGQPMSLQELETLARLKVPLVQVRGQWVQVSAGEIQSALDFWKKRASGEATVRDLVRLSLGADAPPGGLAFGGVTATGWVEEFLKELEGKAAFAELPPPAGFQGELRPYQVRGYSWLAFLRRWGLGACLADDMGLGKTIQTLALVQRDWEANGDRAGREGHPAEASEGRKPVLLICPMSVVGNWKKEAERFTPELPVLIHHGHKRTRDDAFAREAAEHALVISSYALLHRDLALLQKVAWAGVVLDEAQNIKNPQTKQAQAARALAAGYRVALTGTPVENHVGDLWSIWQFLNPGFLGGQAEFRRNFFVPIQVQRDAEAAGQLKRLTGPFLLRRLKTDKTVIADLPDKLEMKVYCTLTKEQASLYQAVVEDLGRELKKAEGIQRKGQILAALSKLKQVCNHPAHFLGDNSPVPGRSGKLARLTEMLEEVLEEGDRALVFTQFTEMGAILQRHLQETFGREVLFLHGGTSRKQRDRMIGRFQEEADGPRVFLLSLKAGGTGLNLTAANHVFHFDRWWNPAVENQATDRAFRIGQTRNVQVHKFLCVGTLEEKIDEMIERKKEVASWVVGAGEAWLTELSNEQIHDLFALRKEAIGE